MVSGLCSVALLRAMFHPCGSWILTDATNANSPRDWTIAVPITLGGFRNHSRMNDRARSFSGCHDQLWIEILQRDRHAAEAAWKWTCLSDVFVTDPFPDRVQRRCANL